MFVVGMVEIYEMKMEGDVMCMCVMFLLDLFKGQMVQFKLGGYYVMLMNLKQLLVKDIIVLFMLKVELVDKCVVEQKVEVCVCDLIVGNMFVMNYGGEYKY